MTTATMTRNLTGLPDELIQAILRYVSPDDALALSRTSRRFSIITSEPLLWKHYCEDSFRWWDVSHKFRAKLEDASFMDWKILFAQRHGNTNMTKQAIDNLINQPSGHLDVIGHLTDAGYDCKDAIVNAYKSAIDSPNHLAQRYWAYTVLGCLNRATAVNTWSRLRFRAEEENATELALAALDMFILDGDEDGDIDDTFDRLNDVVASIKSKYSDIDDYTPLKKATTIAQYLIDNNIIGIRNERHYHSLDHMFLGVALRSSNRNSLPLISAVIYCYVCRQFDLSAQPCSYPFHVHAVLQSPTGMDVNGNVYTPTQHGTPEEPDLNTVFFMDPFNSAEPILFSALTTQLSFIAPQASRSTHLRYLLPATPRDLTVRSAHNIISAPSHYAGPPLHPISSHSASYAALFSLLLLPQQVTLPAQLLQYLSFLTQHFLEYFTEDLHLFENHVLPLTWNHPDVQAYRNLVRSLKEQDTQLPEPKLREGENAVVKYKVGQVFRHRRRGYLAVIYGWDYKCKMREEWITMNQVDTLPRGRGQPFYNVLVDDKSTRYVAEENVMLLPPSEINASDIEELPIEIGKWFKRFDVEKGVFISNVLHEYPEG